MKPNMNEIDRLDVVDGPVVSAVPVTLPPLPVWPASPPGPASGWPALQLRPHAAAIWPDVYLVDLE
jgi:hypothetical protein